MRHRKPPKIEGNAALISGLQTDSLQVETLKEVAELLQTTEDDLGWFPFGATGVMYMSRSRQLDDDVKINDSATLVMVKHWGFQVTVRGDAVIFREPPPWGVDDAFRQQQ